MNHTAAVSGTAEIRAPEATHHNDHHKNGVVAAIGQYFTDTHHAPKSQKELLAETRVFMGHGGTFKRWMLLPAALLNHVCLGGIYDWSVYNGPIARRMSEGAAEPVSEETVAVSFFITVGVLGMASFLTGPWLERHGPRIPALLGATLYMIGQALAALACHIQSLGLLYFGIGVVGGSGLGISYITVIMTLQKYFPDKRGESAAYATGGFGLGGVVGSLMQTPLLQKTTVANTFLIVMCVYAVIQFPAAFIFRFPPEGYVPPVNAKNRARAAMATIAPAATPAEHAAKHESFAKDALSLKYILIYLVFFTSIMSCLVTMPQIADIAVNMFHKSASVAGMVVSVNGFFRLLGKAGFAVISDYFGRMPILLLSEVLQVVALLLMLIGFHVGNFWLSQVGLFICGLGFGAGFGVLPAAISENFEPEIAPSLYGLSMTAWSFAAVGGGILFNVIFKHDKAVGTPASRLYDNNIYWLFSISVLGFACAAAFMVLDRRSKVAATKPKTAAVVAA
ncbi:hypothetical protein GGF32_003228 [Allomyces javanicus]|nr:hypothetical protein GGF32_003228 [Allomyces javanicus]